MKSGNKLNNSFRKALADQPASLREDQWERIQKDLNDKRKRRFLPWLWLIIPLLLVSIGVSYFVGRQSALSESLAVQSKSTENTNPPKSEKNENSKNETETTESKTNSTATADEKTAIEETEAVKNPPLEKETAQNETNSVTNSKKPGSKEEISPKPELESDKTENIAKDKLVDKTTDTDAKKEEIKSPSKKNPKENQSDIVTPSEKEPQISEQLASVLTPNNTQLEKSDSLMDDSLATDTDQKKKKGKDTKKIKFGGDPENTRFTLGFSSGLSTVRTEVTGLSNEKKLHKDSKSLFESSTENQSSLFADINFEWKLFPQFNLGLSGGVQYRVITNDMNVEYTVNDIPFREINGDIAFYIHVDDTSNPLKLRVMNKTAFRFVNVPLKATYGFNWKAKNEFRVSAGVVFSFLAGSSGNTFSLNEVAIRPVGEMVDRLFNMGYTAGFLYSRQVRGPWWLGFEAQLQSNKLNYNLDYGILDSRIRMNNFNLNLRYKF